MKIKCNQFKELSKKALADGYLQKALQRTVVRLMGMRNDAFSSLDHGEALREQAHGIKTKTLDRLDEYLEKLEAKIVYLGGRVHWARDASEARALIQRLAIERGVKTVVKGKSMVTEEIALNQGLMEEGIDVSETDLGEFIIQLADEPPSHLVGPAIHKTKEQISRLFSEKLGARRMGDPEEMTLFARNTLRQRFLRADMGITGVNFAVAETGTLVLFENEGNIRLTTSLPKIHVAVMGLEKVVPTLEDLGPLMKLLARSCTGQKLSSYVSMITGPRREGELDGPDEFHLVILDNGRSQILEDRDLRETLFCIRCGACLNFCPVYLKVGGHAYGWVYSGPIGSILTPQLIDKKQAYPLPFISTLCGACAEVCPVKIDIPKILVALRQRYMEDPKWDRPRSLSEDFLLNLYGSLLRQRRIYETASRMARVMQSFFLKRGRFRIIPPPIRRWSSYHEVHPLERIPFRGLWKELFRKDNGYKR
ncbi:MAG: LutB/LldF family L-lactate oxidation iron-sulfur protein [Pseudomonadota bacterium]